jgi:hypothetical protein
MTDSTIEPIIDQRSLSTVDDWWNDEEADDVEGQDLLRDEALKDLVGVPFRATHIVYREGVQRKGVSYRDDYVSVELRVAPARIILTGLNRIQERRKSFDVPPLTAEQLSSLPGEQLLLNDGSTGIYRQITSYLHAKELIKLPEGEWEGEKGACVLDLPRSQWTAGDEELSKGVDVKLNCVRGLRFSEYPSEYLPEGQMARTWYIA